MNKKLTEQTEDSLTLNRYRVSYQKRQNQQLLLTTCNRILKETKIQEALGKCQITETEEGFSLTNLTNLYFKEPEDVIKYILEALLHG